MITQLSACTMIQNLMDNEMKRSYSKYKIQKIKLMQIGVLN